MRSTAGGLAHQRRAGQAADFIGMARALFTPSREMVVLPAITPSHLQVAEHAAGGVDVAVAGPGRS